MIFCLINSFEICWVRFFLNIPELDDVWSDYFWYCLFQECQEEEERVWQTLYFCFYDKQADKDSTALQGYESYTRN